MDVEPSNTPFNSTSGTLPQEVYNLVEEVAVVHKLTPEYEKNLQEVQVQARQMVDDILATERAQIVTYLRHIANLGTSTGQALEEIADDIELLRHKGLYG